MKHRARPSGSRTLAPRLPSGDTLLRPSCSVLGSTAGRRAGRASTPTPTADSHPAMNALIFRRHHRLRHLQSSGAISGASRKPGRLECAGGAEGTSYTVGGCGRLQPRATHPPRLGPAAWGTMGWQRRWRGAENATGCGQTRQNDSHASVHFNFNNISTFSSTADAGPLSAKLNACNTSG
jgi:hypothetical protein